MSNAVFAGAGLACVRVLLRVVMQKSLWAACVMAAPLLAGCAGGSQTSYDAMPRERGRNVVEDTGQKPVQCVPYARDHSQIKIFGDAWTWWDKAAGKFARAATPEAGAVMVLTGYAGPERGHVAVVQKIISPREIRVDHANWLDDGSIFINDPVVDVSEDNDWSAVRVWNIKTGAWGGNTYPVQGFILPSGPIAGTDRIARAEIPGNVD
jgi:surface antigen